MKQAKRVQRYTWCDALIEAERLKLLDKGAVDMCQRLATAITWEPDNGKPSGLYWKNQTALEHVGSSIGSWKRYRPSLFATGFFTEVGGNLIPQVPDLTKVESQIETKGVSHCDSDESQSDTPYSVDIFSGDSVSVKKTTQTGSDEPVDKDTDQSPSNAFSTPTSANAFDGAAGGVSQDSPESQSATLDTQYAYTEEERKAIAATFGETREQTRARLANEKALAEMGDW